MRDERNLEGTDLSLPGLAAYLAAFLAYVIIHQVAKSKSSAQSYFQL